VPPTPLAADDPDLAGLCSQALHLPIDAAEVEAILHRLAAPPQGRRSVGFGIRTAGGELVGAALGSISGRDPSVGHLDLVVVRPAERRQGLGRQLLSTVESALGVPEMRIAGNPPCYGWPGIDVRYTPALCLAEAAGYQRDRIAWNMTAPLHEVPEPGSVAGLEIRRATEADLPALLPWVASTWNGVWEWEVSQSVGRNRAGCHIALRDGVPVGFAAYGALRPSLFGPMGTDPSAEGLGIGRVLLRRCLLDQRAMGLDSAQIGWVGPVPFYARAASAYVDRVFFLFHKS
jgi:GNAT superfamily N-acetyltransferase